MRVGVLLLGLTSCQWLTGIDPTRSRPSDAAMDAPAIDATCAPGDCSSVLAEGNPGPSAIVAMSDRVAYGVDDKPCYESPSRTEIWTVDKTGGSPTRISNALCMVEGQDVGGALVVLEPSTVTRLEL